MADIFGKILRKKKIEEKFCLEAQNFNQDQLYQRAMVSYFQSRKDDIIFKKSKDKIDDNEKRNNAAYNLFVLKKDILNFNDLQRSFKEKIENPDNTYDPNRAGVDKMLVGDLVLKGMSYGSVVVLTDYATIRDNIELNNKNFYQQSNNKYSFLLTFDAGGDKSWQIFYPSDCCKIISYADVLKVQQNEVKQNETRQIKNYVSDVPKAQYFLLVSDYSYKINMLISDMKYLPLKEIRFESEAHPIDECGRVHFNVSFSMKRLIIN